MIFFDAHLDLAYLAVNGRDMLAPLHKLNDGNCGPHPPAAVTLPSLDQGAVRLVLATLFTEALPARPAAPAEPLKPEQYISGDIDRAHRAARAQLEVYLTWRDRGLVALDLRQTLRRDAGVGDVRGGMGVSELHPPEIGALLSRARQRAPLHIGVLMENADPIRSPDEIAWWKERGLVAVGLTWARASRFASGNSTPPDADRGLTTEGAEMLDALDDHGITHDVSHLSDRALEDMLSRTNRPVIASHSNCRAITGDSTNQRHLRDDTIIEIGKRGGVIGLNLCRNFIPPAPYARTDPRPSIEQAVRHVEHVCELLGSRSHVGLGSDMDGGFSALDMPDGIDRPSQLTLLTDVLVARGWSDDEVRGFAHANWARFFGQRPVDG